MLERVDRVQTGLERLSKGGIDVVLVDLGMPEMPGDQVAQGLRQADPAVALVLMSGWELRKSDPRLAPFDFCVQKPLDA